MKIDYRIIWVEDKIDSKPFQSLRQSIFDHLKNEFFDVSIETAEDFNEFKRKYERTETFDLIVTDLNLNESHGSQVIDFVRDVRHVLTEVFFYSANSELSKIKLLNNSRITFHKMDEPSAYRELGNSITDLINLTIVKFNHIVAMRGMIMQETSDLDEKSLGIISNYFEKFSDEDITNTLFDEIISFHREKLNKAERYKRSSRFEKIIADPIAFSATQRANTLSNIIDKRGLKNFIDDYKREILAVRNQFAHATLDEDKQVFRTRGGQEFNAELCKKIRKDINTHIQNVEDLIVQLKLNS